MTAQRWKRFFPLWEDDIGPEDLPEPGGERVQSPSEIIAEMAKARGQTAPTRDFYLAPGSRPPSTGWEVTKRAIQEAEQEAVKEDG